MSTLPAAGDTVRIRDERWVVARIDPAPDATVVVVRGCGRTNLGTRAAFLLPFDVLEPLASSDRPALVRGRRWRRTARAAIAAATPSWSALRAIRAARISLLPFQLEPALAVTQGRGVRLLIADEVGLGKTIQAGLVIAEILARTSRGRVLVVAPASLREQWQAELAGRFALDSWIADSLSLARLGAPWTSGNPWSAHAVTITSIDFVKRPEVLRGVEGLVWDAVVFDEAHGLAGRSDRATAARALARRGRVVALLTATPHSGDEDAFHALCGIGDLDHRFPLLVFRRTRADAGLARSRTTRVLRVRTSLAERAMHDALMTYARRVWTSAGASRGARLAMGILIRRGCSSARSLAQSVERRLTLIREAGATASQMALPFLDAPADEEPGAELAAPGLANAREEQRLLQSLLTLARRAENSESKVALLGRLLRRASEPAIVFTEYRDTLTRLAADLQAFSPVVLHGGLGAAERRDALRAFTAGSARLLLATDAASEGLNLQQRCRLVINLEIPWSPLRLEQRVGRVDRIGQSRPVHELRLVAAGTAEEAALEALTRRSQRAAHALERMRPSATDEGIAAHAIGGEPLTFPSQPPGDPGHLVVDLRGAAEQEAGRIEMLRTLSGSAEIASEGRPPFTIFRGSRCARRGAALVALRLTFTDAERRLLWETLVGLRARVPASRDGVAVARALFDPGWSGASNDAALASLISALAAPLDLAQLREQAMAEAIDVERARLAARLVQPGLFDRRAERTIAAQRVVLDEALARCQARLADLASARSPRADRPRLALAAIWR